MEHYLAIIEDHEAYREAMVAYFDAQPEFTCVVAAGSIEEFVSRLAAAPFPPALILCDIGLPGLTGIEGLPRILRHLPSAQVLMLSVYADSKRVFAALCAGAVGYVVKGTPLPHLREHLLQAAAGGSPISPSVARHIVQFFQPPQPTQSPVTEPLTPREQEVLQAMKLGMSYKQIAGKLFISLDTTRNHIRQIYRKLHVNSQSELLAKSFSGNDYQRITGESK